MVEYEYLHPVPHIRPFGMVVRLFSKHRDPGHEPEGGIEIRKAKGPGDRVPPGVMVPLRQRGQKLIALGIGQLRHPSLPSSAPRMGCSPFSPHRRRLAPPPHSSAAGDIRQAHRPAAADRDRSEEHTSELQSLMRISYAVFCLKK